ncbi:MAG: DUF1232 domain-containing protein [Streptosporangiaceae bacterium]
MWWHVAVDAAVGPAFGVLLAWLALVVALLITRPKGNQLTQAARLLPDLLRLLPRLARDDTLPRGVRAKLWLLLAYLALPFDIIPDLVPVIGYADDAIVAAAVLRSVVRRAGPDAVADKWTGTPDGLAAVLRVAGHRPVSREGPGRGER